MQNIRGDIQMTEKSYFAQRPDVVKIFNDLERFKNFCRFEFLKYDEKNLYNGKSREWRAYVSYVNRTKKQRKNNAKRGNNYSNKQIYFIKMFK